MAPLLAHIASNMAALAAGFLLITFVSGNLEGAFFLRIWDDTVAAGPMTLLFGVFCVLAVSSSLSLPATWIGVVIARRYNLAQYWQFALLGVVAAFVIMSAFILLVGGAGIGGLPRVLASFGASFVLMLKVGMYLAPICVAAALTYRAVVGCADHMGSAELP